MAPSDVAVPSGIIIVLACVVTVAVVVNGSGRVTVGVSGHESAFSS